MTRDILNSDRVMRDLRQEIDEIDSLRAASMAAWIVSTVVKIDHIESGEMNRAEATKHWQPYNEISLLTRRRDRRTVRVGTRKEELEAAIGEPISISQEGRWQSVKFTYLDAVREECKQEDFTKEDGYVALEWMHHYTEYEHVRSINGQKRVQQQKEDVLSTMPMINAQNPQPPRPKLRLKFPHISH